MHRTRLPFFLACLASALWAIAFAATVAIAANPNDVQFNRDVRPILSETCFLCHGPDAGSRQADLRLDVATDATADRGGYAAIVAGDPDASEAWLRIASVDPGSMMPPPDSHLTLTDAQKQTLRRWIEQGATYRGHWAFTAPQSDAVVETDELHHRIDHWVDDAIDRQSLTPTAEADAGVLLRRLTMDLTGLPPTPAAVRAFRQAYAEHGESAYQKQINTLLASRHFGERWAVPWLDAARYADTNGYSIDGGRDMWLWRDWVIESINQNQPIDQFIVEQLAGDLLPDASEAQKIATGFNRNHMITHEGGTIPEENLTNYVADRVKTTGEVFLGLTIGCAQCHDHKYDPISHEEYYRFFAFFNQVSDRGLDGNAGQNSRPAMTASSVLPTHELDGLQQQIASLEKSLATHDDTFDAWVADLRESEAQRGAGFKLYEMALTDVSTPNRTGEIELTSGGWVNVPHPSSGLEGFSHTIELPDTESLGRSDGALLDGIRIEFEPWPLQPSEETPPMLTPHASGVPIVTTVLVSTDTAPTAQVNFHRERQIGPVTASSFDPGHPPTAIRDQRNQSWWQPANKFDPAHLTVTFDRPVEAGQTHMSVLVVYGQSGSIPHRWRIRGFVGNDDDSILPAAVAAAVAKPTADWSDADAGAVDAYWQSQAPQTETLRVQLANLRARVDVLTKPHSTMVMDAAEKPRETFILDRGAYDAPTTKVTPGTLSVLPPMEPLASSDATDPRPRNRLDLARWLVRPDHPLTARVAVNQIWSVLFGQGLVATEADFGSQGSWPSHPELLDELALGLVHSGWDRKALIRQMVASAAYRRDSRQTDAAASADPENIFLARGRRFRLPAEMIRDTALSVSGLMVDRIGGPSVQPYQPAGLWKEVSHFGSTPATQQVFVQDQGEDLYRRSLYTVVKRTSPHPAMAAFDAPNREMCVVRRSVTNTPVQSLVTLNDPQFSEAARHWASELLQRDASDVERIGWAFEAVTSRPPSQHEEERIAEFLRLSRARYASDPTAAADRLRVGESPVASDVDTVNLAAWTSVCSLLLNLSETLTRS